MLTESKDAASIENHFFKGNWDSPELRETRAEDYINIVKDKYDLEKLNPKDHARVLELLTAICEMLKDSQPQSSMGKKGRNKRG